MCVLPLRGDTGQYMNDGNRGRDEVTSLVFFLMNGI